MYISYISYNLQYKTVLFNSTQVSFLETTFLMSLRGTAPPTQKLACLEPYLKVINIFLKNNICILQ